ncbi:hypothetical protein ACHAWF_013197 [Thalassiosira exigua]
MAGPSDPPLGAMRGYMMKRKKTRTSSTRYILRSVTLKWVTRYYILGRGTKGKGRLVYYHERPSPAEELMAANGLGTGEIACEDVSKCTIDRVTPADLAGRTDVVNNSFYVRTSSRLSADSSREMIAPSRRGSGGGRMGEVSMLLVTNGPEDFAAWIDAFQKLGASIQESIHAGLLRRADAESMVREKEATVSAAKAAPRSTAIPTIEEAADEGDRTKDKQTNEAAKQRKKEAASAEKARRALSVAAGGGNAPAAKHAARAAAAAATEGGEEAPRPSGGSGATTRDAATAAIAAAPAAKPKASGREAPAEASGASRESSAPAAKDENKDAQDAPEPPSAKLQAVEEQLSEVEALPADEGGVVVGAAAVTAVGEAADASVASTSPKEQREQPRTEPKSPTATRSKDSKPRCEDATENKSRVAPAEDDASGNFSVEVVAEERREETQTEPNEPAMKHEASKTTEETPRGDDDQDLPAEDGASSHFSIEVVAEAEAEAEAKAADAPTVEAKAEEPREASTTSAAATEAAASETGSETETETTKAAAASEAASTVAVETTTATETAETTAAGIVDPAEGTGADASTLEPDISMAAEEEPSESESESDDELFVIEESVSHETGGSDDANAAPEAPSKAEMPAAEKVDSAAEEEEKEDLVATEEGDERAPEGSEVVAPAAVEAPKGKEGAASAKEADLKIEAAIEEAVPAASSEVQPEASLASQEKEKEMPSQKGKTSLGVFAFGDTYDEMVAKVAEDGNGTKALVGVIVISSGQMTSKSEGAGKNRAIFLDFAGGTKPDHLKEIERAYCKGQGSRTSKIHSISCDNVDETRERIVQFLATEDKKEDASATKAPLVFSKKKQRPSSQPGTLGSDLTDEITAYKQADPVPSGKEVLGMVRDPLGTPYNWVLFRPSKKELIVEDAGSGGVAEMTRLLQEEYNDRVLFGLARLSFVGDTFGRRQFWAGLEWKGEDCYSVKMKLQLNNCLDPMKRLIGDRSFTLSNVGATEMTPELVVERVRRSCNVQDFDATVGALGHGHAEEQKAIKAYWEREKAKKKAEKEAPKAKVEVEGGAEGARREGWAKMPAREVLEALGGDTRPGWVLLEVAAPLV